MGVGLAIVKDDYQLEVQRITRINEWVLGYMS
jgi:hypothetical protein